jgi:hypothetical protein
MGDFVPGYVTTFANPHFDKLTANIIIVGKEDGKIYGQFDTKAAFFERMNKRKASTTMMCYYRVVDFTEQEHKQAWRVCIHPVCEKEKNRIAYTWKQQLAMFG